MTKRVRSGTTGGTPLMSRRSLILAGGLLVLSAGAWAGLAPSSRGGDDRRLRNHKAVVHMSPWCGCCSGWVDHLRQAGLSVEVIEVEDVVAIKRARSIPEELYSCHTAELAGYAIEGHVPVPAIDLLLTELPEIDGIALAGMPPGSPGMDGEPWAVFPVQAFRAGRSVGRFMDVPGR